MTLNGRTALVTGASRGIGRAIAERLAADGAHVAVHYASNDDAANDTVAGIRRAGGTAFPVRAELGVAGDVDTLFDGLTAGLGDRPLDILVNNAALTAGGLGQVSAAEFDRLLAVNVRAPYFIVERAIPLLRDGGRIINISSGATRIALPEVAYAMTKGAIDVFTRSLANLLGPRGITVNTVAPGVTATDMNAWIEDEPELVAGTVSVTALGRIGRPVDIADAVAFLAADDARWITGNWVDASGGLHLGPGGFRPS